MSKKPKPIDDALRAAIERSGLTVYALSTLAGVTPQQVGRFVKGERDITLGTASKLAQALGLELVAVGRK
jgi:plasmid maintenance system antidote protein VapI